MNIEPQSPIKIDAGLKLNTRNPISAPINAEARISLAEATAGTAMAPAAMRQNVCQNVRKRYAGRPVRAGDKKQLILACGCSPARSPE